MGSHFAGDFFLGVDIMVTSMLVNFLLICITLLVIPRRNPKLAGEVTALRSRRLQVAVATAGIVMLSGFLCIHVLKDLTTDKGRVVLSLDAGLAYRHGARHRNILSQTAGTPARGYQPEGTVSATTPGVNMHTANRDTATHISLGPELRISRVVNGLWQIADMERSGNPLDVDAMARNMKAYTSAGLTTFDMADHYGSAEDVAGVFSEEHAGSDKAQLLTKWVPEPGRSSRQTVRRAVDRALTRLRQDRIDLLQYHAWNYADPAYLDHLFYLQELCDEGRIAHLGLTNFDTAHLRIVLASGIKVVSNQVCYSLLDQRAAQGHDGPVSRKEREVAGVWHAGGRFSVRTLAWKAGARNRLARHLVADEVQAIH